MQRGLTSGTVGCGNVGFERPEEDRMKLGVDDQAQQPSRQRVTMSKTVDRAPIPTDAAPFSDAPSPKEAFDAVSTLKPLVLKKAKPRHYN